MCVSLNSLRRPHIDIRLSTGLLSSDAQVEMTPTDLLSGYRYGRRAGIKRDGKPSMWGTCIDCHQLGCVKQY